MTIQQINIGTSPNDNTGDDPRTAAQKLNSNFSTPAHAASREVGTAAGQIPDADDLNMAGATENYTSNNLNPNVFGGSGVNDILASGYRNSSTTCLFLLPISEVASPASVTLVSSFGIKDALFNSVASGVTNLTLESVSNSKILVLSASGLSSGTIGSLVVLTSESLSSKITVNPS